MASTGKRLGRAGTGSRLVLLALLLILVAVGLHGTLPSPVWNSYSKLHDARVVGALEVVVIVLILALGVRRRRAPPDQLLAARLRTALGYGLGAGAAALAVTLVLLVVNIHPPRGRPVSGTGPIAPPHPVHLPAPTTSTAGSHFPLSEILYGLAAAILVLAIVAVALRVARYSRAQPAPEPEEPAQEYGRELQEALVRGQRALLQLDDARAAIIACYSAMEKSLARAGTARSIAETPDELLARAARTLVVSAGAARRLTALFYEARFSSHPLFGAQRDAAETALGELVSDLDDMRPDMRPDLRPGLRPGAAGAGA